MTPRVRKTPKTAKENPKVVDSAYSIYILTANSGHGPILHAVLRRHR